MHIANFTPDTIKWLHVGITGKLEPDDITEFEDARGKHILNKWGARGLLRITYDDRDREDEMREKAMEIYRSFWSRQISNFNQHNESLKNQDRAYVYPTKMLSKKAEDFGIDLIQPWKLKPPVSETDKKEMDELKDRLGKMEEMMSKMVDTLGDVTKQRDDALVSQFTLLNQEEFKPWLEANLATVRTWPKNVQTLVQVKWIDLYGSEVYPLTA